MWIDYFRELDTTANGKVPSLEWLWIDYFRELDTTMRVYFGARLALWIDYFRELDTTVARDLQIARCCGLITLGN